MPYSVPPSWAYLDYPTAAKMNQYKTGMDAISAQLAPYTMNICVCHRMDVVDHFYLVHQQRWLLYTGAGRIVDPSDVNDPVSLSDSGGAWANYDLSQVSWIFPGRLYQVQDVICCFEDVTGF
jgi:hypothetical protein